jgi:hypothetical protein
MHQICSKYARIYSRIYARINARKRCKKICKKYARKNDKYDEVITVLHIFGPKFRKICTPHLKMTPRRRNTATAF